MSKLDEIGKIEGNDRTVQTVPDTPVQHVDSLALASHDRVQQNLGASLSDGPSVKDVVYGPFPEAKAPRLQSQKENAVPHTVTVDPFQVSKDAAVVSGTAAAGLGAAYGGLTYAAGLGAKGAAVVGGLTGLQVAVGALGVQAGGEMHNVVWSKPGSEKPGKFGTFARGLISPLSIPVGLVRNMIRGRQTAA